MKTVRNHLIGRRAFGASLAALLLSGCALATPTPAAPAAEATKPAEAPAAAGQTLTVMVHDSFAVSEALVTQFESAHNVKLVVLKSGDAGATLNKAILAKGAPIADVLFGVDNTFLSRALKADIFEAYEAPALSGVPARFRLDPSNRLLPIDYGYVSFNSNPAGLAKRSSPTPGSLRDLTAADFKNNVVVENASTSSPGLAFLLATVAAFPEGSDYSWQQFWRDMMKNEVHVSPDWTDAYYTMFSGSSGQGPHDIVLSYATSPAAEVFYSEGKLTEPPTANLDIGAFEQIEFAGVLKGAKQPELARRFIDFLLSADFQKDIPTQMWVYPVVENTPLPDVFRFAAVPTKIYSLTPEQIDAGREKWIEEWTKIVAGG
jgi:thiamine transport system substrate-binding protein